ncbi:MAG TPA: hypothetical protein ENJ29_13625 [Bacteroidetes bacterium]|nr:hypothetical protein [Bacteroidota bacterium]
MYRKIALFSLCLILSAPMGAYGQLKKSDSATTDFSTLMTNGQPRSKALAAFFGLDPERFRMSQSYTLGVTSFGGTAISQGVYLNSISYDFSIPLTFNLEWGVRMNPLQAGQNQNAALPGLNNGLFLSGASLEYKPSKNFQIGVSYSSYPLGSYPGSYTRSRKWLHDDE